MKAMILAAGLGTRLRPLTADTPKPLLPILGRPLLDILIRRLRDAGFTDVIVNTHHLAPLIEAFIRAQAYGISVTTRYEPEILGTGGAIRHVEDFWDKRPFLVINGDVLTNIDLRAAYDFHLNHEDPVTLILHDCAPHNHVWLDPGGRVRGFGHTAPCPPAVADPGKGEKAPFSKIAYTGIQVLDPGILSLIPKQGLCSIIDVFCDMLRQGLTIRGLVEANHYWHDIGTPEGYQKANRDALVRDAFARAFPGVRPENVMWSRLKGDGSDRLWYRVCLGESPAVVGNPPCPPFYKGGKSEEKKKGDAGGSVRWEQDAGRGEGPSIIVVDHGAPAGEGRNEADAFAAIGRHLLARGVPVPRILVYDRPSGLVALEDLGDVHLQRVVKGAADPNEVQAHYRAVIDRLVVLAVEGAKGFDLKNTCQTTHYDRELILEKEARYFVEAFLNDYLGHDVDFDALKDEFQTLADRAVDHPYQGFLHRDFQSRNILVKNNEYYFIDFQGGRLGPLQYDPASLLIDPYVALPENMQETLLDYYIDKLSGLMSVDRNLFVDGYRFCALNRNLQILGAFAFLSRQKGKADFEGYIPAAVSSLKRQIGHLEKGTCSRLRGLVEGL